MMSIRFLAAVLLFLGVTYTGLFADDCDLEVRAFQFVSVSVEIAEVIVILLKD